VALSQWSQHWVDLGRLGSKWVEGGGRGGYALLKVQIHPSALKMMELREGQR